MKTYKKYRPFLLILIPPFLVTCICLAILVPKVIGFFRSEAYPDSLWSQRVLQQLEDDGYSVHNVSVLGSDPSELYRSIDIQVGNLKNDKKQRTYELVEDIHSIIFEKYSNPSYQPEPVNMINVTVIDYSNGSYYVFVEFETAWKYQQGEISEEEYFKSWSYDEDTPEISPPQ